MQVKSDNYINIQGWMIAELGLKNTELLVYAIIYGFSQDGQGRFRGTLGYLMDWTQASKPTVLKALDTLQERGLIAKDEVPQFNGQRGVEYRALPHTDGGDRRSDRGSECDSQSAKTDENPPESAEDGGKEILPPVKKFDGGGKETLPGGLKNFTGVVKKFYSDNKDNNINNTIGDNNIPSSAAADGVSASADDGGQIIEIRRTSPPSAAELSEEFEAAWKLYPRKEGKEQARRAYLTARRSGVSAETIRAGIEAYNERIDREQIGMRYIAHGGNWFEGKRWEDANTPAPPDHNSGARCKPFNRAAHGYKQRRYTQEQLIEMGVIDMSAYENSEEGEGYADNG